MLSKKCTYAISAAIVVQPPSLAVTDYENALRIYKINLHKISNNRMYIHVYIKTRLK